MVAIDAATRYSGIADAHPVARRTLDGQRANLHDL